MLASTATSAVPNDGRCGLWTSAGAKFGLQAPGEVRSPARSNMMDSVDEAGHEQDGPGS